MAKVRYIGDEPRVVPWLGPEAVVEPDQVVEVPDEQVESYLCQLAVWEPVADPKTSAKRAKGGE